MTSVLDKEFTVMDPVPGQCLKECKQTWNQLTSADKWRLGEILGFDVVLRLERMNTR